MASVAGRQILIGENYIFKNEHAESETFELLYCNVKTDIKQIQNSTHNGYLINRISDELREVLETESFRRMFLHLCDCVSVHIKKFLLESYSLPSGFVEMVNQIDDYERDTDLKWIIYNNNEVLETIADGGQDVLKDFGFLKDYKNCRIGRSLK